jgi:hypothetical protein
MKKIFSIPFSIAFLLIFLSFFSQKTLATTTYKQYTPQADSIPSTCTQTSWTNCSSGAEPSYTFCYACTTTTAAAVTPACTVSWSKFPTTIAANTAYTVPIVFYSNFGTSNPQVYITPGGSHLNYSISSYNSTTVNMNLKLSGYPVGTFTLKPYLNNSSGKGIECTEHTFVSGCAVLGQRCGNNNLQCCVGQGTCTSPSAGGPETTCQAGSSGTTPPKTPVATTGPGKLTIHVSGVSSAVFHSVNHTIGNCNPSGPSKTFTVTGSKTCSGTPIGDSGNTTSVVPNTSSCTSWTINSKSSGSTLTSSGTSLKVHVPGGGTADVTANCGTITCTTSACVATANFCDGRGTQKKTCGSTITTLPCTVTPTNCETGNTCNTSGVCAPVTPTVTPIPTVTPVPSPGLALIIGLDGIGHTGDQVNDDWTIKTKAAGSNQNPKTPIRPVTLTLVDTNNKTTTLNGNITFASSGTNIGKYVGTVPYSTSVQPGSYQVKVSVDGHETKTAPGFQTIVNTSTAINVPSINLITGDVDGNNTLDGADYNILLSCITDSDYKDTDGHALCNANTNYKVRADLEDNGVIDKFDYNLFLREFSVQSGN